MADQGLEQSHSLTSALLLLHLASSHFKTLIYSLFQDNTVICQRQPKERPLVSNFQIHLNLSSIHWALQTSADSRAKSFISIIQPQIYGHL